MGLTQGGVHRAGGGISHVRQHVRIDVEREANVGVTQELLDELGVDALPQQERSAGVPQVVKAGALREPGALERGLESAVEVAAPQGGAEG